MSKSVREGAAELFSEWKAFRGGGLPAFFESVVAPRLATDALLECGKACMRYVNDRELAISPAEDAVERAGRALAAERAGKEWNPPGKDTDYRLVMDPAKPDTSREDAALASYLIKLQDQDMLCFGSDGIALVAACRKAREPKPPTVVSVTYYSDGKPLTHHVTPEQGRDVARLLRLEAK